MKFRLTKKFKICSYCLSYDKVEVKRILWEKFKKNLRENYYK